jgi:hypothetical protein
MQEVCPSCQGRMSIIAFIDELPVIKKILQAVILLLTEVFVYLAPKNFFNQSLFASWSQVWANSSSERRNNRHRYPGMYDGLLLAESKHARRDIKDPL